MKKNGFTLIELLAVIIVISIIAVITVPIVLDTIDNSKKGTAMDSAYGYVEAVNRLYYSNSMDGEDDIDDGIYSVSELKTKGVSISGKEPSDGWVELVNGDVVSYSIKFGDYVITKYSDSDAVAAKGEVQDNGFLLSAKTDVQNYIDALLEDETVQAYTGDVFRKVSQINLVSVPIGMDADSWIYFTYDENASEDNISVSDYSIKITEGNYTFVFNCTNGIVSEPVESTTIEPKNFNTSIEVIKSGSTLSSGDTVKLKWRGNTEVFKVLSDSSNIDPKAPDGTITLLAVNNINTTTGYQGLNGITYGVAFSESQYWQSASNDIYDSSKDKAPGDVDYSVAYYVNMYVENLQALGFNVDSGRILNHSEVYTSGRIAHPYHNSGEFYWTASADCGTKSLSVVYPSNNTSGCTNYFTGREGVRPVIYINESNF